MPFRGPPNERDPAALLEFGVINLDKPSGPSSHQVSAWVRDLTGAAKAAHAGTLDPKVTGCLPVLLGDATRLAGALGGEKEYVAILELHAESPRDLAAVLADFTGPIYQKPPRKSAVERTLRTREIYELEVLDRDDRRVLLRIRCESGTYIRKLCHDLGLVLGTGGHMGDLRRIAAVPFDDTTLVTLHDLADALAWLADGDEEAFRNVVRPGEAALSHLPSVTIAANAAEQVAHGAPVYAPGVIGASDAAMDEVVACYTPDGGVVCLGRLVGDPRADEGVVVTLERVLV